MYCEKIDVEKFLNITITESLDFYIKTATEIINKATDRVFTVNKEKVVEEIRVYSGDNNNELIIDDFFEISEVKKADDLFGDNTEILETTDYMCMPFNADKKGQPFTSIMLKYSVFPFGYGNHSITGKFGYGSVPADIKFACIALAGGIYNYSQGGDEIKSESIGGYSVSYGGDTESWTDLKKVKEILQKYKRYHL